MSAHAWGPAVGSGGHIHLYGCPNCGLFAPEPVDTDCDESEVPQEN